MSYVANVLLVSFLKKKKLKGSHEIELHFMYLVPNIILILKIYTNSQGFL
jgi:hypothetical protein